MKDRQTGKAHESSNPVSILALRKWRWRWQRWHLKGSVSKYAHGRRRYEQGIAGTSLLLLLEERFDLSIFRLHVGEKLGDLLLHRFRDSGSGLGSRAYRLLLLGRDGGGLLLVGSHVEQLGGCSWKGGGKRTSRAFWRAREAIASVFF
jgi:hypothetical protein